MRCDYLDNAQKPLLKPSCDSDGQMRRVDNFLHDIQATRRQVLKTGFVGMLAGVAPLVLPVRAQAGRSYASHHVAFRNAYTGDSFSGVYRVGDRYLPDAFERINYVLRDIRTGEVFPMDPHLIDILSMLHQNSYSHEKFEVLSGYRSPKTNAMLRRTSSGVAENSLHMYGQAIDMRLPGLQTIELRNMAIGLRVGGVGYYPKSDFVHVDTGEVSIW